MKGRKGRKGGEGGEGGKGGKGGSVPFSLPPSSIFPFDNSPAPFAIFFVGRALFMLCFSTRLIIGLYTHAFQLSSFYCFFFYSLQLPITHYPGAGVGFHS